MNSKYLILFILLVIFILNCMYTKTIYTPEEDSNIIKQTITGDVLSTSNYLNWHDGAYANISGFNILDYSCSGGLGGSVYDLTLDLVLDHSADITSITYTNGSEFNRITGMDIYADDGNGGLTELFSGTPSYGTNLDLTFDAVYAEKIRIFTYTTLFRTSPYLSFIDVIGTYQE